MLLSGSQGIGKTTHALRFIARIRTPLAIHVYLPTLTKAEEALRDYERLAAGRGLPAMVVRGLGAPDPDQPERSMCHRAAAATAIAKLGMSPRRSICEGCPLTSHCGSQRQSRKIRRLDGAGVYFMPHAYLFLPSPAPAADLVIVDERVTIEAIDVIHLPIDDITVAAPLLADAEAAGIDVAAVLNQVRGALSAPNALAVLRHAGIGRAELAALRKAADGGVLPSITGRMKDETIRVAVEQTDRPMRRRLVALLAALEREIDMPRAVLNAVSYEQGSRRVVVSSLRRPRDTDDIPLLLLDGTGDIELNRMLFGEMEHQVVRVERNATVIGTTHLRYSRQSITGRDSHGQEIADRVAGAAALRGSVANLVRRFEQKVLLVATKGAEDALVADGTLPAGTETTHFGALRGRNGHEHCEVAVALGRESLSIAELETQARAYMADDPEPFVSHAAPPPEDWLWKNKWPYRVIRMRRMRTGTLMPVEVEVHPDPRVQRILEQIREAEIVHAIDRVRPVFNRRHIIAMNELVLDVTYDRVMTHADLVKGGDRIDQAWARDGVVFETPGDQATAFPELLGSEDTAKRALKESRRRNTGADSPWQAEIVQYRRENQRGRPARARIAPWVSDPASTIERLLGPVRVLRTLCRDEHDTQSDAADVAAPALSHSAATTIPVHGDYHAITANETEDDVAAAHAMDPEGELTSG
jgi:hypothetical protein